MHIYNFGGTYADVDTYCFTLLDSYIDFKEDQLVVGIEMTPLNHRGGLKRYVSDYCSPFQILQWTFAASPKHPALAVMLKKIKYKVHQFSAEHLVFCSKAKRFTLELTGPMLFTAVIIDFLSKTRSGLVTVLDQLCWGNNQWSHNMVSNLPDPKVKVQHLFDGKWKMNAN